MVVKEYINKIIALAKTREVEVSFVIIPHDYFVDELNKRYWVDIFQFQDVKYRGPTAISKVLTNEYDSITYAKNLRGVDYLKYDGHLTPMGNKRLAEWTVGILKGF